MRTFLFLGRGLFLRVSTLSQKKNFPRAMVQWSARSSNNKEGFEENYTRFHIKLEKDLHEPNFTNRKTNRARLEHSLQSNYYILYLKKKNIRQKSIFCMVFIKVVTAIVDVLYVYYAYSLH